MRERGYSNQLFKASFSGLSQLSILSILSVMKSNEDAIQGNVDRSDSLRAGAELHVEQEGRDDLIQVLAVPHVQLEASLGANLVHDP